MFERPTSMKSSALLVVLAVVTFSACGSETPVVDDGPSITSSTVSGTTQTSPDVRTTSPSEAETTTTVGVDDGTPDGQLGVVGSGTTATTPQDTTTDDETADAGSSVTTIPPLQPPLPKGPNPDPEIPPPRD